MSVDVQLGLGLLRQRRLQGPRDDANDLVRVLDAVCLKAFLHHGQEFFYLHRTPFGLPVLKS